MQENKTGNTQFTEFFTVEHESEDRVKMVLAQVYDALREKGYNPANQIVGYIMSGDPTYITSHNGARSLIMKIERDELVEEMFNEYIKANGWE
ncbi:MAG: IreB family regulatory phosphoprotein [Lachnospiraceae bacterium]|nr:IreB family regulatory phosphoprotein [Lachnospiraceae bacterium]